MKKTLFNSDFLFPAAIVASAGIHVALIVATSSSPFATDASVAQGPNSLEINVIQQPLVSVLENEILTEEIQPREPETAEEVVLSDKPRSHQPQQAVYSAQNSRELRGALTKAKPLMHVNPAPLYPKLARKKGWEGTVRLTAIIEKDGTPRQVGVAETSGHAILDKAAVDAVRSWKFTPAQSGSARFSSKITIPIRFDLIQKP